MNRIRREGRCLKQVPKPMKDNRGFTLVELIIVMLIMAILAVGSMVGFNLLNVGSAKHASERILSVLSSVQMENLTKSNNYTMEIYQDSITSEYKLRVYNVDSAGNVKDELTEALDLKDGQITFENSLLETLTVNLTNKISVCFRKDSGSIKEYSPGKTVTRIGVKSSGRTCYIRLVTATGKHFIE